MEFTKWKKIRSATFIIWWFWVKLVSVHTKTHTIPFTVLHALKVGLHKTQDHKEAVGTGVFQEWLALLWRSAVNGKCMSSKHEVLWNNTLLRPFLHLHTLPCSTSHNALFSIIKSNFLQDQAINTLILVLTTPCCLIVDLYLHFNMSQATQLLLFLGLKHIKQTWNSISKSHAPFCTWKANRGRLSSMPTKQLAQIWGDPLLTAEFDTG